MEKNFISLSLHSHLVWTSTLIHRNTPDLKVNTSATCRLSKNGDVVRVSSKGADVPVDPGDGSLLVPQTEVSYTIMSAVKVNTLQSPVSSRGWDFTRNAGVSGAQEAQSSHSISQRHYNDVPSFCNFPTTVQIVVQEVGSHGTSGQEASSVDPDHDGQVCGHWRTRGKISHWSVNYWR